MSERPHAAVMQQKSAELMAQVTQGIRQVVQAAQGQLLDARPQGMVRTSDDEQAAIREWLKGLPST